MVKILWVALIAIVVMSAIATAKLYEVTINLDEKEDYWLEYTVNNTGKSIEDSINVFVKKEINEQYDNDLIDKFVYIAEEIIVLNDYKKTEAAIVALEKILNG